jgi:hypothetical protein
LLSFRNGDHRKLRRTMGEGAFEAEYQSGRNLPLQAAVELAIQEPIST